LKNNKSVSAIKTGMNRDVHISQLSNIEYIFLLNGDTSNETGEGINIQNEPSNFLAVVLPTGYKVIHHKLDILKERTYLFLTNPTTKKSSIGYIKASIEDSLNLDVRQDCDNCSKSFNILGDALENTEQEPYLVYTELINDICHDVGKGLNFDINFPIKKSELKQEKLGTFIYWNDYNNPPRLLNLTDVEENPNSHYLITQEQPCADDTIVNCIIVDKLLLNPNHSRLIIEADVLQTGGNLKLGTYEFYVAYCDSLGNEMTEYSTPTNPISIFDENNNILSQTDLDTFTNYSIKLKVNNLDFKKFSYYKVVCVERNNVDNTQSAFVEGIHPTTDDTIVYTHSGSSSDDVYITRGNVKLLKRIEIEKLFAVKNNYKKFKGTMSSGDRLWHFGGEQEEEINLQPVVNLIGAVGLKWQTSLAKEDLYNDSIATSKYKGFNREEVQPFSFRFLFKNGGYSPLFPIVGRPGYPEELQTVSLTDKNFLSLDENTPNCAQNDRNKYWQIFNTATVEDIPCTSTSDTITVEEDLNRTCIVENVSIIPTGTLTIELDEPFTTLEEYINDTKADTQIECSQAYLNSTVDICEYLYDDYSAISCELLSITLSGTSGTLLIKIANLEYTLAFNTNLTTTVSDFITANSAEILSETGATVTANANKIEFTGAFPLVTTSTLSGDLEGDVYRLFPDNCDSYIVDSETIEVDEVVNEQVEYIEKIFPTEYKKIPAPKYAFIYALDYSTGGFLQDPATPLGFTCPEPDSVNIAQPVYIRDSEFSNQDCDFAEEIYYNNNVSENNGQSFFHNYAWAADIAADDPVVSVNPILLTAKTSDYYLHPNPIHPNTYFFDKINKTALWFEQNTEGKERFIIDVSKQKDAPGLDFISTGSYIRFTLFKKCSDTTHIYSNLIDLNVGGIFLFEKSGLVDLKITNSAGTSVTITGGWSSSKRYLIALDCPISVINIPVINGLCSAPVSQNRWIISPTTGAFTVSKRDIEFGKAEVTWDEIRLQKRIDYTASCLFEQPKVKDCEPVPYKKGKFAYWESTETYPNNKELYDSSNLNIKPSDLALLSNDLKSDFEDYFTEEASLDLNGNYILKQNTDLTCANIRHPKFPSQSIAPFMSDKALPSYSKALIYPLGVTVEEGTIETILNISLSNNLITQEQYDNIESFEILRGDNTVHKSIIASGLGYDMYQYFNKGNKYLYSNYPHNDLGADVLHCTDSSRTSLITHPYGSKKNNYFSFISPDLLLTKPTIPNEVILSGYQLGNSITKFVEVEDHPKWTILGRKARNLATTLALAEFGLEVTIKTAEFITQGGTGNLWITVGTSSGSSAPGVAVSAGAIAVYIAATATQGFMKIGQYRYEWLKIFENLGSSYNFANYGISVGKHNYFLPNTDTKEYIRGISTKKYLKDGSYQVRDENNGQKLFINNTLREYSTFISLGNYYFNYDNQYRNYDNNLISSSNGSKTIASQNGCLLNFETQRNVGSPYMTLKNYIPDQWGTIDSIKWLTTNHIFKVNDYPSCNSILGGTVVISRFTWKRKIPIFSTTAMGLADKLPFNYSPYNNVGYPRFYCDYKVDTDYNGLLIPFPDIDSTYNFDCKNNSSTFYVKPNAKMYLYYYGITDFLVESEINCNFRYAKKELKDNFYPQVGDVVSWTQEKNLSIKEPNSFYYNNVYSFPVSNTPYKFLDNSYSKEVWKKRLKQDNLVIYSEMDNNNNSLTDPWRVYKPLNFYEFGNKFGKLIDLKDIESAQFLARFENQLVLHNAIDSLAERITPQNKELGTAGIFAQRPLEFKVTDLGYMGTQHSDICSTPFGHFWVDAKRGKIFQVDQNGKQVEIISESIQGKPVNIKQWFREHLPMKILKHLPEIDVDNKYKGIGFNIWYDDRRNRVFFTKRDYVLNSGINKEDFTFDSLTKKLYYNESEVFFDNKTLFKDVSWTISYKPQEGSWTSYFSFYPDYSPFYNNYFQVGYNWGTDKGTLWTHPLNNTSFQVFQGILNPFTIEFPIQNQNINKQLNSLSLNIESKRFQNQWDFNQWKGIGFNKLSIWTNNQHSGILNLNEQKSLKDLKNYPKTNAQSQDILYTPVDGKQNINYFYNRVVNQDSNTPNLLWDENKIFKNLNFNNIKFTGKRVLERLTGESFTVGLTNDKESRFNIILKSTTNDETVFE